MKQKLLHSLSLILFMFFCVGSIPAFAGRTDLMASGTCSSTIHSADIENTPGISDEYAETQYDRDSIFLCRYIVEADSLMEFRMNSDVLANLSRARDAAEECLHLDVYTPDLADSVYVVIRTAVNDAYASIGIYRSFVNVFSYASRLDKSGVMYFDANIRDIMTSWQNGLITTGITELREANRIYVEAVKNQTTIGVDMTEAISDYACSGGYSFGQYTWEKREEAIPTYWKIYDGTDDVEIVTINQYFHVNTWTEAGKFSIMSFQAPFIELCSTEGDRFIQNSNLRIKHVKETGFRPGKYMLTALVRIGQRDGFSNPEGYSLNVNNTKNYSDLTSFSDDIIYSKENVYFEVDKSGELDICFNIDHPNFSWFAFSSLNLVYYGYPQPASSSDTLYVDVVKVDNTISDNYSKTSVRIDENNEACYVYEPADSTKGMTIAFDVPLDEIKSDMNYKVTISVTPPCEAKSRPAYLGLGLQGIPSRLTDGCETISANVGHYVYSGNVDEVIEWDVNVSQSIKNPKLVITTSADDDYDSSLGLKTVTITGEDEDPETRSNPLPEGIDFVDVSDETTMEIYSPTGSKLTSLQHGMNLIKMPDGTIRKVRK